MFKRLVMIVLAAVMAVGMVGSKAYAVEAVAVSNAVVMFPDWMLIAAQTIGVKDTTLTYGLSDGQSITEIAAAHGVSKSTISTAIIDAEKAFLPTGIAEGYYTEEDAAQWQTELPAAVDGFLDWKPEDDEWSVITWGTIAATVIDLNEAELNAAYAEDQSIADVAKAHNVDPQTVIDAIIAYETELSQNDPEWLSEVPTIVQDYVETRPSEAYDDYVEDYCAWECVASQTIGITEDELYEAYEQGLSIADVAKDHNVDIDTIIDAIMVTEREWAATAVADGIYTQAEAEQWLAEAPAVIKDYLEWK